jgi:hypothetical protein
VNNSDDISWHKNRVFISEVFRFEELGFELITPGFYRVFFRGLEIGEFNVEELRLRSALWVGERACERHAMGMTERERQETAFSKSRSTNNLRPGVSENAKDFVS